MSEVVSDAPRSSGPHGDRVTPSTKRRIDLIVKRRRHGSIQHEQEQSRGGYAYESLSQRDRPQHRVGARYAVALGSAGGTGPHRNEIWLRHRCLRSLYGASRWHRGAVLQYSGCPGRRRDGHHHRGSVGERNAAPRSTGLARRRSLPMRLLPARHDHGGGRAAAGQPASYGKRICRRDARALPLRNLSARHAGLSRAGVTMTELITRRTLLQIGAYAGGFAIGCLFTAPGRGQSAPTGGRMNAWVLIGADDAITVRVAHTEMGQGSQTLAVNRVAEELEVDPGKVQIEPAPVAPEYETLGFKQIITGGSSSAATSFDSLRLAGASARALLVAAAAKRWQCAVQDCEALDGRIRNRKTDAVLSYGAVAGAAAKLTPPREVNLKPASAWRLLGRPMRRLEGRDKVQGIARFGIDVQLPNMLIATVINCPVPGGRVRTVHPDAAMRVPGIVKVLPLDTAVVVVANSFWAALQALEALKVDWDEGPGALLDSAGISRGLDKALAADGIVAKEQGDAATPEVKTRIALRFEVPLLAHAAFEPPTATVSIGQHNVDVWAPTQVQTKAREVVAAALGTTPQQVRIHTTLAGGSFGRKLRVDYLRQAALTAKAVSQPVKLIWSRSEDMQHDYYRPPAATTIDVGLGSNGLPVSWTQRLAVPDLRPHIDEFKGSTKSPDLITSFALQVAAQFPSQVGHHHLTWHHAALSLPL